MALYAFRTTVQGSGVFPLDMLRRDRCFPADSEDVNNIGDFPGLRCVRLVTVTDSKYWKPNEERWLSFGWKVIHITSRF